MAKLKKLKYPRKPKLPKKPAASASLSTKQSWLRRVQDIKKKYEARCSAVDSENKKREIINKQSAHASEVIAGIGDITMVRPSQFKTSIIRKKRSSAVSGHKKRKGTKRKATRRKSRRR